MFHFHLFQSIFFYIFHSHILAVDQDYDAAIRADLNKARDEASARLKNDNPNNGDIGDIGDILYNVYVYFEAALKFITAFSENLPATVKTMVSDAQKSGSNRNLYEALLGACVGLTGGTISGLKENFVAITTAELSGKWNR